MSDDNSQNGTAETSGSPPAAVTADEIIAPLGQRMPPVTEGQTKEAAPVETPKTEVKEHFDRKGVKFDPAIHAANPDGTPKLNKFGSFYSGNVGRGAKGAAAKPNQSENTPAPTFNVPGGVPVDPNLKDQPPTPDEYDMMAEVYLQSAYGPLIIALSEGIRPNSEQHTALKQSLAAYLRHKKAKELSPGWGFAVTAAAVFVARTSEPTVKDRLALWAIKIKSWFKREKK